VAQTNVLAGIVYNRVAQLVNKVALGASLTTTVLTNTGGGGALASHARGQVIPYFHLSAKNHSSSNFAAKVQDSDGPPANNPGLAEASWDWFDLVTFTAVTGNVEEDKEVLRSVRSYLRAVLVRTGGSFDCVIEKHYAQVGPRSSRFVFAGTVE